MRAWLLLSTALYAGVAAGAAGRLLDAQSGAPIAGARLLAGQTSTQTDADGRFDLEAAATPLRILAPGYRARRVEAEELAASGGLIRLPAFTPRALYLSAYGIGHRSIREAALRLIQSTSLNALVIDVKTERGQLPYPSAIPLAAASGARKLTTLSDLAATVAELHRLDLYLIARIVVFKDEVLASAHPEWAVHRADGDLYRDAEDMAWIDPYADAAVDYNLAVAVEAAQAGFDEIQFDYLRFPDAPRLRYAGADTRTARVAAIGRLLDRARQALSPYDVFVAADVFGYVCWNRDDTHIGQQLEALLPRVDYLSPMLYPSGFQDGIPGYRDPVAHPYEIVLHSLQTARRRTQVSPRRFRPWLQAFRDYAFDRQEFDADEVQAQVRAAEQFGADGWMLWNPRNVYEDLKPETDDATQAAP